MRSLGYCCGRKHIFSPQVLCCYGKQLCAIPRDTVYYNYQNRFVDCSSVLVKVLHPCYLLHVITTQQRDACLCNLVSARLQFC